jgi:hypothetical protein
MPTKRLELGSKSEALAATLDHRRMHADDLRFFSENAFWRDQVAEWQHETQDAAQRMSFIRETLEKHQEKLRQHAAAIRLYEQTQAEHETSLARFERGGMGEELVSMAMSHQDECRAHENQREYHEWLKRRHHELLTKFKVLVQALEAVEHGPPDKA